MVEATVDPAALPAALTEDASNSIPFFKSFDIDGFVNIPLCNSIHPESELILGH